MIQVRSVPASLHRELVKRARGMTLTDYIQAVLEACLDLPITRHGHELLLSRCLALRQNFSVYEATCVALAERLDAALLTADTGLARAARAHVPVA